MEKNTTESIVAEIKALLEDLRSRGLSEEAIESLVSGRKTGRVILDRDGLTLPEYDGVKVRLTPMERTLYTLVMRYSQGIPVDALWKYYDELCDIYGKQTVYDDQDMILAAVEALCDDYRTTLYTNVSRIRRKLTDKLGRKAAEPYIISRGADNMYRIFVDRSLVSGV